MPRRQVPRGSQARQAARNARPYLAFAHPRPDFLAVLDSARQALDDAAVGMNGQPKKLGRPRKVRT